MFRNCKDKNNIESYLKPVFDDIRLKFLSIESFKEHSEWDIEKRWNDEEKIKMGVKKADVVMNLDEFRNYLSDVIADINEYGEAIKCLNS